MTDRRALAAVRELLRALNAARQVAALYPRGHPQRTAAEAALADHISALRAHAPDAVLFITRHAFYLGEAVLARESLALGELVAAFERAGVEALEFVADPTPADCAALVEVLLGGGDPTALPPSLQVNRVHPHIPTATQALEELRRSYAAGLSVVRASGDAVAAGRPVDLDAALRVVDRIVAAVTSDPQAALLLTTIRSYDEYTYYHMVNVCILTVALATAIGLHREQVTALGVGALLHDIGKVNVPRDILSHTGPLSPEQWRLVQRHPVDGAAAVFATGEGLYHPAAAVVLEHHAAYDQSGYPTLSGRPSMAARLVAVVDCFDAVTADRSYRPAAPRPDALRIIAAGAGRHFDPRVVRLLVGLLGPYPVGSVVRTASGATAVVVGYEPGPPPTPRLRLVLDAAGDPISDPEQRPAVGAAAIVAAVPAEELGLDVVELLATGSVEAALHTPRAGGLVHEPSPTEPPPPGFPTHPPAHGHRLEGRADPDAGPPLG